MKKLALLLGCLIYFLGGCGGEGGDNDPSVPAINIVGTSTPLYETQSIQLSAQDSQGLPLTGDTVTWSSSDTSLAMVSASGLVSGIKPGKVMIRAVSEDAAAEVTISVQRMLPAGYRVGVDYHAISADFEESAFLKDYDVTSVRNTVKTQLAGMAAAGADFVKTTIWLVGTQSDTGNSFKHHFPLTDQELLNLKTYVQDVAAVQTRSGAPLRLQLTITGLWCADYTTGSWTTTIGQCNYTWNEYVDKYRQSSVGILDATASVLAADSTPVTERVYAELEVMVGAKANQDQFLKDIWPRFEEDARLRGLAPSIYFNISDTQEHYFDDSFVDPSYPQINGHRSMFWLYRSVDFLRNNNLPVPARLDFSFYFDDAPRSNLDVVKRVFDDFAAVFPETHAGIAEIYYRTDRNKRVDLGRALAAEYHRRNILEEVAFWTTPDGGGPGVDIEYPFDIDDFRYKE